MSNTRTLGRVKWFNNGYGFVTVITGELKDVDVFVHHSAICVDNKDQYKYLVMGEYVEFEVEPSNNDKHKHQATNVTGINRGKLMCETHYSRPKNEIGRAHV